MLITLFTDVSHDHRLQIGAYAWWAKVDGEAFRGAGLFREAIDNNNVAEVYGLINGVYAAINAIRPPAGAKFLAQSDSGMAIAVLQGRAGGERYVELHRMMQTKLTGHGLEIEYRYVAGHKGSTTPRNAVNSWCDRTARMLMRQRRRELQPS